MTQTISNQMRHLKVSVMSLMILGACGAVAYNVLAMQNPKHRLPGSTAVQVQVNDVDVAKVSNHDNMSSIGQLLESSQSQPGSIQNSPLTASIQDHLSKLGFYNGALDGKNGPHTLSAIKKYQIQNSLRPTGLTSQSLLDHLKFSRKISEAGKVTGSINKIVSVDQDTLLVQKKLVVFGYAPGKADGVFGSATRKAIKQFEADRSMPITGQITAKLLQELGI